MIPILRAAKESIERIAGCHIYRNSMPHGVDCFFDIERRLGRNGIRIVFDVGANIGQSALRYVHEFPRAEIYSFEPVAATYQELVAATRRFSRVHPYNFGMGREAGDAQINVNPISRISSIVQNRPEDHPETIKLETIADFAESHRLEAIDFLKIDTEGFDLEVLAGAAPLLRQQRIHFVLSECEPVVRTKKFVAFPALADSLAEFDYSLFGVYEQQPEWDGRNMILYWNALFIGSKLIAQDARLP